MMLPMKVVRIVLVRRGSVMEACVLPPHLATVLAIKAVNRASRRLLLKGRQKVPRRRFVLEKGPPPAFDRDCPGDLRFTVRGRSFHSSPMMPTEIAAGEK